MKKITLLTIIVAFLLSICSCSAISSLIGDNSSDNNGADVEEDVGNPPSGEDVEEGNNGSGNNTESGDVGGDGMNDNINTPIAEVLPVKGGAKGIVVLIHDDAKSPTGIIFDELLSKYGLVADVAMPLSSVYNSATGEVKASNYATWSELCSNGRWKIVSHSATHTWWGLAEEDGEGGYTFSDNEKKLYDEVVASQTILRNLFKGQRVLTFAYPGFSAEKKLYAYENGKQSQSKILDIIYSENSRELIDETYISARVGNSNLPLVTDDSTVWNYLAAYSLSNGSVKNGGALQYVNRAINEGGLAVMYAHNLAIVDESMLETYEYPSNTMAAYYMESICSYVSEKVSRGILWCTHYEDAVMYIREAQTSTVSIDEIDDHSFALTLTDGMDDEIYDAPLTVKITLPDGWSGAKIATECDTIYAEAKVVNGKSVINIDLVPNGYTVVVERADPSDWKN